MSDGLTFKQKDRVKIVSGINKDEKGVIVRTPPKAKRKDGFYLVLLHNGDVIQATADEMIRRRP